MANTYTKQTRIWVHIKRLDINIPDSPDPVDVYFDDNSSPQNILRSLRRRFNLSDDLVLKIRNHRGSLLPVNNRLGNNSKSVPYILEVVSKHQHVTPGERKVKQPNHAEVLQVILRNMKSRIENIEAEVPNIKQRSQQHLNDEMAVLDQTLSFLNKRLGTAENSDWQGMFNKHPMW